MPLTDIRTQVLATRTRPLCRVGRFLTTRDAPEVAAVQAALDDAELQTVELYGVLRDAGYAGSETTLRRHRADRCHCAA